MRLTPISQPRRVYPLQMKLTPFVNIRTPVSHFEPRTSTLIVNRSFRREYRGAARLQHERQQIVMDESR